jgi:hypothetical protein
MNDEVEGNKERSRRLYEEVFGQGNYAAADDLMAAGIVNHGPGSPHFALYLAGLMRIVCPVGDGSGTTGVSIFDADADEVDRIMRQDPAVKAGLFRYEIHATQTFPESRLTSASPTA